MENKLAEREAQCVYALGLFEKMGLMKVDCLFPDKDEQIPLTRQEAALQLP